MIKADGNLSWLLRPALAIRGEPVAAGLASRAQNARNEDAIRADEQTKMQAAGGSASPQNVTTTISQSAPASPAAPATPKPPVVSHHKK